MMQTWQCPTGHMLKPPNDGSKFDCDICGQSDLSTTSDCLHCSECDFDVCSSCKSKGATVMPKVKTWQCPTGHTLKPPNDGSKFDCDICGQSDLSTTSHCLHCSECDFDVCASCKSKGAVVMMQVKTWLCPNGHNLMPSSGGGKFDCDVCKVCDLATTPQCLHCSTCDFDICSSCKTKNKSISLDPVEATSLNVPALDVSHSTIPRTESIQVTPFIGLDERLSSLSLDVLTAEELLLQLTKTRLPFDESFPKNNNKTQISNTEKTKLCGVHEPKLSNKETAELSGTSVPELQLQNTDGEYISCPHLIQQTLPSSNNAQLNPSLKPDAHLRSVCLDMSTTKQLLAHLKKVKATVHEHLPNVNQPSILNGQRQEIYASHEPKLSSKETTELSGAPISELQNTESNGISEADLVQNTSPSSHNAHPSTSLTLGQRLPAVCVDMSGTKQLLSHLKKAELTVCESPPADKQPSMLNGHRQEICAPHEPKLSSKETAELSGAPIPELQITDSNGISGVDLVQNTSPSSYNAQPSPSLKLDQRLPSVCVDMSGTKQLLSHLKKVEQTVRESPPADKKIEAVHTFLNAARDGKLAEMNVFLQQFPKMIDAQDDRDASDKPFIRKGATALIYAAKEGKHECVKALLEAGAEKDMQDDNGETAMMKAVSAGFVTIVETLLLHQAIVHPSCIQTAKQNAFAEVAFILAMNVGEFVEASFLKQGRFCPVFVCSRESFLKMKRLKKHEIARAEGIVVELPENAVVVFFSQRWLSGHRKKGEGPYPEEGPHPDTDDNMKYNAMCAIILTYFPEATHVWMDYLCVSQIKENAEGHLLAYNSLPYIVRQCTHFVVLSGTSGVLNAAEKDEASYEVYLSRGWCRLECLSAAALFQQQGRHITPERCQQKKHQVNLWCCWDRHSADVPFQQEERQITPWICDMNKKTLYHLQLTSPDKYNPLSDGVIFHDNFEKKKIALIVYQLADKFDMKTCAGIDEMKTKAIRYL